MDEFSLIRTFFTKPTSKCSVLVGVGDDCAVLSPSPNRQWVVSVDTMIEGVHFPMDTPAGHIGTRALCAALSDLAAMGAAPECFTLALTLPHNNFTWLQEFSKGLFSIADEYNCPLVGGDTTRGPLCLSVQVHGSVASNQALLRSGARAGDGIYVSGVLGDGAAALAYLLQQQPNLTECAEYLKTRFYCPSPQIELGQQLVGYASAALDVSDGLLADLNHLCEASGVYAEIECERIPLSNNWSHKVSVEQGLKWALTGGDDYQLLFTVPAADEPGFLSQRLAVTKIGCILAEPPAAKSLVNSRVHSIWRGSPFVVSQSGFNHFG